MLRRKYVPFKAFKKFKALAKGEKNDKMQCLRTNKEVSLTHQFSLFFLQKV